MSASTSVVSMRPTTRGSYLDLHDRRRIIAFGDFLAASVAATGSLVLWGLLEAESVIGSFRQRIIWIPILAAMWMTASFILGSYLGVVARRTDSWWPTLAETGVLVLAGYLLFYFLAPRYLLPRIAVLAFVAASTVCVGAWRRLWDWIGGLESMRRPVVIVGASRLGSLLADILSQRGSGYAVIGFVDDDPEKTGMFSTDDGGNHEVFGTSKDVMDVIERYRAPEVVLAFRGPARPELVESVLVCHERGVMITSASDLYEAATGRVPTWHVGENWGSVLPLAHPGGRALHLATKRFVDVVGAVCGLAVLAVLLPVIALAIKADSHGPVFYAQPRTGRGRRPFTIRKLRTMMADAEEAGPVWAAERDPRSTRVGRWLRRTHVDELPQLWNVLRGEMSLVGPRPERPEIEERLEQTIPFHRLRLAVKPGIAGWGAVNGSYVDEDTKAIDRLEFDLYYIKHQSLWLDMQILASAARRALFLRGR